MDTEYSISDTRTVKATLSPKDAFAVWYHARYRLLTVTATYIAEEGRAERFMLSAHGKVVNKNGAFSAKGTSNSFNDFDSTNVAGHTLKGLFGEATEVLADRVPGIERFVVPSNADIREAVAIRMICLGHEPDLAEIERICNTYVERGFDLGSTGFSMASNIVSSRKLRKELAQEESG